MKRKRMILLILAGILLLIAGWLAFCGYEWSWGPFYRLHDMKTSKLPGNDAAYGIENAGYVEDSPLAGKHVVFLGSSVTYGAASKGVSFADYLAARNGMILTKEAVSGTTLVDNGLDSYIARLKRLDKTMQVDLFVCQLSTNDATQKKQLGKPGNGAELKDFDTATVAGAIEYIITYARETWNCPVLFYTNPRYDSPAYADMVEILRTISAQRNIKIIDLWNDDAFNTITSEQRVLYMADAIHPTQAGYLLWWIPAFESKLYEITGR